MSGLLIFKDYGISWDEELQQETGLITYDYVFNKDPALLTWRDRDYGVAFELLLVLVRKVLGWNAARDVFHMRYLLNHCFFLAGAWSVFLLLRLLLRDSLSAIAGMLLYQLHPRLFADSFYNTKDIPFASLFAICLYI